MEFALDPVSGLPIGDLDTVALFVLGFSDIAKHNELIARESNNDPTATDSLAYINAAYPTIYIRIM